MLIGEGKILLERVIARPYQGEPGAYERENENRHDYGISPPEDSYMDLIKDTGLSVVAVLQNSGIFAGAGSPRHLPPPPGARATEDAQLASLGLSLGGLAFAHLSSL